MASISIPWNDGNGNIILTYSGQGDGVVTVATDADNLGDDRSQVLTLRTTAPAGSTAATAQVLVTQPTGMRTLTVQGIPLRDSQGRTLRVPPQ